MTAVDPNQPVREPLFGMMLTPRILTIFCSCVAALLGACGEWPPHQEEIVSDFYENESKIDALREKLLASKYRSVSNFRDVSVTGNYIDPDDEDWTIAQTESPHDEDEWLALFAGMHVHRIARQDYESGVVVASAVFYSGDLTDEIGWQSHFIYDVTVQNQVMNCADENPKVRCGTCVTELGNSWWLRYWWEPHELTPEASDAHLNGEMTDDEYYSLYREARLACFTEGGTIIGDIASQW